MYNFKLLLGSVVVVVVVVVGVVVIVFVVGVIVVIDVYHAYFEMVWFNWTCCKWNCKIIIRYLKIAFWAFSVNPYQLWKNIYFEPIISFDIILWWFDNHQHSPVSFQSVKLYTLSVVVHDCQDVISKIYYIYILQMYAMFQWSSFHH